jgi:MFS family permease
VKPFYGWRMVALAFVAYNTGLTVVVNSFGPALLVLERELNVSRARVSLAFGLLMLSMGLLSPVVGHLIRRFKLRTLMMTGAGVNALGFLLLAFAGSLNQVLLIYGLLIGAGVCLMALISAPTLISRWFEQDRGKAFGFGLVQVFALVAAPCAALLVARGGRSLLFFALAGLFAVLIPVMGLVIDRPEDVGQMSRRAQTLQTAATHGAPLKTSREIFADRRFWLLCLVIGIYSSGGVALSSHGTAMAVAKGASITLASTVLSASGAGALIGAIVFGWLIDRIGPFVSLIAALIFTAIVWLIFAQLSTLPLMVTVALLMGAGMGPAITLHSACINELFGAANFGRVMGYSYFIKIPFLFGPAPLAGRLYDLSHGYGSTYVVFIAAMVVAALLAVILCLDRHPRAVPSHGVSTP